MVPPTSAHIQNTKAADIKTGTSSNGEEEGGAGIEPNTDKFNAMYNCIIEIVEKNRNTYWLYDFNIENEHKAHKFKKPITLFTDQDIAMGNAVRVVIPEEWVSRDTPATRQIQHLAYLLSSTSKYSRISSPIGVSRDKIKECRQLRVCKIYMVYQQTRT
ncbi:hypothetical protein RJ639_035860 [Escallonia herrerae]|uniref:Uncharacterized protein n=1 Tax=Escallonia herrerae TaxID=1293975 RepID=A0AA88WMS7_9ASTE|nr:hypothetical protein RJ639_035860 [Escallonia herrerae]